MTDPPDKETSDETPPSDASTDDGASVEFAEPQVIRQAAGAAGDADDSLDGDGEPDPLAEAKAEVARIRDQLVRTLADFDNFRKRTRRELTDVERKGREDLLRELLPVFDNLERAHAHSGSATDLKSLADGLDMVLRQFYDTLARAGIERMMTVGTPFDPAFQEAIQQVESAELEPGTVAAEVQAGYRIGDRLVRPAMVVVAKRPLNGA